VPNRSKKESRNLGDFKKKLALRRLDPFFDVRRFPALTFAARYL
jgi:hypothetical protein